MPEKKKKIHFVGVGGIGMSAIAQILIEMGHAVSGSDEKSSHITRRLEAMGGRIFEGHAASNLPAGTDILVYSSSIAADNPELKAAARRGIRVLHRAQMLGRIFNGKKGIAVAGTHGKTTTTSLISVMLENTGRAPTAIIGGEVDQFGGNAKLGAGAYAVVEADESDSSFLRLKPLYAVITNIEMEHLDHFTSLAHIQKAYRSFLDNLKTGGAVFYNFEDLNTRMVLKGCRKRCESFGLTRDADIHPINIRMEGFTTSFTCVYRNNVLGTITLKIPGRHNILNALAAILVGLAMGLAFKEIARAIKDFDGARRRFQLVANAGGVMVIDDYAHHPTEIRAALDACRNWKGRRVVAIFQPHRYSRTKLLADDFGRCFAGADKLILADIYAASEKAIAGVTTKLIYDRVRTNGLDDVSILKRSKIPDYVMRIRKPGDIILVLGAGDIKEVAVRLADMFAQGPRGRSASVPDTKLAATLRAAIRGTVRTGEELSRHTSLRIGGRARLWVEPCDTDDLKKVLRFVKESRIPMFILGNGSNVLAGDAGFNGVIIHLGAPSFRRVSFRGTSVGVGAGYSLPRLVRTACERSLGGLESLVGIPGTVGGALYMNAGGWNNPLYKNIGALVRSVKVMDYNGAVKRLGRKDLSFGYRSSNLDRYIILEAELVLAKGNRQDLLASCGTFLRMKKEKQVLDKPNAGCFFKNPEGFQFTCGQMIDMLRLKGTKVGGAQISTKHANFIINSGSATCNDVLELVRFIRDSVRKNYGIELELEVKML